MWILSAGHNIDCFECHSAEDARCGDPFNYTLTIEDMPPLARCEGCCVKLVQNIGTSYRSVRSARPRHHAALTSLLIIRRTCTDRIDINLWLVHHGIIQWRYAMMCPISEARPCLEAAWARAGAGATSASARRTTATWGRGSTRPPGQQRWPPPAGAFIILLDEGESSCLLTAAGRDLVRDCV